ncbi:MAG: ABC transporter permease [Dehalococcoidia bacterium]|nr:ABC transporter permease [Dehalococcoidia bacterium]
MQTFILRRTFSSIFVLFIVTLITFFSINLLPGDLASRIAGEEPSQEQIEMVREALGLNRPLHVRYFEWIGGIIRLDLGDSLRTQADVSELIGRKLAVTAELGLLALIVAIAIAIPVGVLAGARPGTFLDYGLTIFAVGGVSIPNFFLAMVFIIFFAVKLGWFPALGTVSITEDPLGNIRSLVLPIFTIGLTSCGSMARQVRGAMVEVMRQDYVRTARSKGLQERDVILRHVFRNALIPVVTVLGLQMTIIIGGSIITETIFKLPGMGKLLIDSIYIMDTPIVQGIVLVLAATILALNLLVDISYAYLDPRIRYS